MTRTWWTFALVLMFLPAEQQPTSGPITVRGTVRGKSAALTADCNPRLEQGMDTIRVAGAISESSMLSVAFRKHKQQEGKMKKGKE